MYYCVNSFVKEIVHPSHICRHSNLTVFCYFQSGYLDSLTSSEFVKVTRMVEEFVVDCEGICGRQSHSLRATLLSQAKKFMERFHEERKNKLR